MLSIPGKHSECLREKLEIQEINFTSADSNWRLDITFILERKEGWNFNEQRVNRKNLVKEEQIAQILGGGGGDMKWNQPNEY